MEGLSQRETIERLSGLKRKADCTMSLRDISSTVVANKKSRVSHTVSDELPTAIPYTISEDRTGSLEDEKVRLLGGLKKQPRSIKKTTALLGSSSPSPSRVELNLDSEVPDSNTNRGTPRLDALASQYMRTGDVSINAIESLTDLELDLIFDVSNDFAAWKHSLGDIPRVPDPISVFVTTVAVKRLRKKLGSQAGSLRSNPDEYYSRSDINLIMSMFRLNIMQHHSGQIF